jgi:hypothetical protein
VPLFTLFFLVGSRAKAASSAALASAVEDNPKTFGTADVGRRCLGTTRQTSIILRTSAIVVM